MNVSYNNGTHAVLEYTPEALAAESAKPEFVSAKIYEPGKIIHMSDRDYRVGSGGNLIRIGRK